MSPLLRGRWLVPLLAATLGALLQWLSFPPQGAWPLSFLTLVPLCLVIDRSLCSVLAAGWWMGALATLVTCPWLPGAARRMLGTNVAAALCLLLLLAAWNGVRYALLAGLYRRARLRIPTWLALPLAAVAAELLVPSPLPFSLSLGASPVLPLLQVLDLGGRLTLVFVLAAGNVAVLEVSRAALRQSRCSRSVLLFSLAPLGLSLVYAHFRTPAMLGVIAAAPKLDVGVVQVNEAPELKRARPDALIASHLALSRELAAHRAPSLLVWSETAVTQPLLEGLLVSGLKRRLQGKLPAPTILGAVIDRADANVHANSVLVVESDGYVCPRCRYDKQQLVPIAEGPVLPRIERALGVAADFQPGSHTSPLPFGGHEIAVAVCYEALFPDLVRRQIEEGAELIVNVANDGWFGDSSEPWLQLEMARFRAVETRRFLIRAATTGPSAIIDATGATVAATPTFSRAQLRGDVAWLGARTPYVRWGDLPWQLASICLLLAVLLPSKWARQRVGPATRQPVSHSRVDSRRAAGWS